MYNSQNGLIYDTAFLQEAQERLEKPLTDLLTGAFAFATRRMTYEDMLDALADFRLKVHVGLQTQCPICQSPSVDLTPADCPGCEGRGWVWKTNS
jgi:hypothetical protein